MPMAPHTGKSGALICCDPKEANVILVDPTSDTGKDFIREWGNDTDKVVLKHSWVEACITASKALGKEDEWGGFLTIDDRPKEGSEATVNPESLLPTPRPTPIKALAPSLHPTGSQTPPRPKLFIAKTFFVQMQLSDRRIMLKAIKTNGGKVISAFETADYAIFSSRESPYEACVAAKVPTVVSAFVDDCIAEHSLLDTAPYRCSFPTDFKFWGTKRKRVKIEDDVYGPITPNIKSRRKTTGESSYETYLTGTGLAFGSSATMDTM
ncbi:hypothetical protein C0991_009324 [Blastosporella zonata]|nr:hypothetical protein C0991_009324 [Blastosporella zonata]